jgi:hypothetical protein
MFAQKQKANTNDYLEVVSLDIFGTRYLVYLFSSDFMVPGTSLEDVSVPTLLRNPLQLKIIPSTATPNSIKI